MLITTTLCRFKIDQKQVSFSSGTGSKMEDLQSVLCSVEDLFDFLRLSSIFFDLLVKNRRGVAGRAVSKSLTIVTPRCRQNVVGEVPDVS